MEQPMIAIVTNDPYEVDLIDTVLVDAGYENSDWFTHTGAYLRCRGEQPDLVILCVREAAARQDWRVLEVLHADPATVSIPVVVCTSVIECTHDLGRFQEFGNHPRKSYTQLTEVLQAVAAVIGPPVSR